MRVIGYFIIYKGVEGTISKVGDKYYGCIHFPRVDADYTADSLEELEIEYHKAVDKYWRNMAENGMVWG